MSDKECCDQCGRIAVVEERMKTMKAEFEGALNEFRADMANFKTDMANFKTDMVKRETGILWKMFGVVIGSLTLFAAVAGLIYTYWPS